MAPQLSDGVPGLEAVHTLTPPSPYSSFALNDWLNDSTGETYQWTDQSAYTLLTEITGIHDAPDSDDQRVDLIYQHGELPLPRFARGRTITYSGIVYGQTLSDMRNMAAAIRACVTSALTQPTAWLVSVAYDTDYDDTGMEWLAYGIPLTFTCDDSQPDPTAAPTEFQRAFTLTFRQSDGRWWQVADSFLCTVGSADSPIDSGTEGTLTMTGTAPSEPTFTVYGTGEGDATIVLENVTTGDELTFDLASAMNDGDQLVVTFGNRSAIYTPAGDGTPLDYTGFIDWANSSWWEEIASAESLLIGSQSLQVTGDQWSCSAYPACW